MNLKILKNLKTLNLNWYLIVYIFVLLLLPLFTNPSADHTVLNSIPPSQATNIESVGAGSYTTTLPAGGASPPSRIWKSDNLKGAISTADWVSSVLFDQYSYPLYAHPLAYRATAAGWEVGFPFYSTQGYFLHRTDFIIESADFSPLDARLDHNSDWFADILLANGEQSLRASIGHGSPYSYYEMNNSNPIFTFDGPITIFSNNGHYIGITTHYGNSFGIFTPTGSSFQGASTGESSFSATLNGNYFSVVGLPNNSINTFNFFAQYAYTFIINTQISWQYNGAGELRTIYKVSTITKEGSEQDTVLALYPHQWRNNPHITPLVYTYPTVRGQMKTILGTSYQTSYTYPGILPTLPNQGAYNSDQLSDLVDEAITGLDLSGSTDTYWGGKEIGRLAQLLPIAEQVGNTAAANTILSAMKSELECWLTADGDEDYYYDREWGTLIGYPTSFGTATHLNDHHFHYGYWIQAAAQIALRDQEWASEEQWGGMINLLIRDIASADRTDEMFPFLRYFDIYEGHSWASGDALANGGNNQESSSEAINAWAGMILWGEATGNRQIRDTGIFLYTTEVQAVNEYYFDLHEDIFAPDYAHTCTSLVWGGQYEYRTWWTGDPIQIHGIIMLPITPASLYLGTNPTYVQENYDYCYSEWQSYSNDHPGADPEIWADILNEYLALSDPSSALFNGFISNMWQVGSNFNPEAGESKAHSYHWVHNLNTMGLPDFSITAKTPLSSVFSKDGVKTYVVYNAQDVPVNVSFSDGYIIQDVLPHSMSVNGGVYRNATIYSLNTYIEEGGIIDPPGQWYFAGETVTLTAIADPGYHFVAWTGDVNATTQTITITMDSNITISAIFERNETSTTTNTTTTDSSGGETRNGRIPGYTPFSLVSIMAIALVFIVFRTQTKTFYNRNRRRLP